VMFTFFTNALYLASNETALKYVYINKF